MSDPLAIVFEETIGAHCAQWIDEGSAECSCGHRFDHKPADDWEAQNMQVEHWCTILAAAARAFIADEINAKYEAEKPTLNCWDPRDDGYEYGLDIAEQIARGDTK
ncbi:hypothetical protein [Acidipropionibacterium acidipropionici]|uniref:hypothetical protein n=1 Tax=Acidipropionibacterium acidipropionici TaxID=1748 RepID=UPI00110A1650|nr:hypothetical protein [Acidipropionibacterium acidipropionici]QCV95658.1 hypothetical protein FEZ30_10690 [Acidipropionibacterium acidipropionici]